jgi:hypothetical protein
LDDQDRVTVPVEETGGGDDGGVVDGGATTGVDGCSNAAKPGFVCIRRAIEGERLADTWPEPAAAVDGAAAARLRDEAGVATALREDIESGTVGIGAIGRSLTDAGMLFNVPSETVGGNAAGRFPADESLELVLGAGADSETRGATAAGGAGFFINLWWSPGDEGGVTEGGTAAIGRDGGTEDSGWATTGDAGAAGRWMRLCRLGASVSPAKAGAMKAIVKSQAKAVTPTVCPVRYERCENSGMVTSARSWLEASYS